MGSMTKEECPDANTLAAFVEMKLLDQEHEKVFLHIAECSTCRDYCRYAMEMNAIGDQSDKLSERDKANILAKLMKASREAGENGAPWRVFVNQMTAIFSRLECAEVVAAGELDSVISFSADDTSEAMKWKLKLFIPTQQTTMLRIQMEEPWRTNGTLIFCGNQLNVANGEAEIAYEVLKKSFRNPEVAFIFENGKKVLGYPELIG